MKFLDFFSGIGGFRLGMEMAGHECVGHCEIDKYADKSYRAMHNVKEDEWYANDITGVEPRDLPEADCYCGGFPCQSFSIAGKRGGFEDIRGTLFFEVMRLAAVRKPKYLFLENVGGLLSHDGGKAFGTILNTLGELGYWYEYQVLNSKNFGVPQNRGRVFIIGHLGRYGGRKVFPIRANDKTFNDLQRQQGIANCLTARYEGAQATGTYIIECEQHAQEVRAVLTPDRLEKRQNGRRMKEPGEEMFTLTAQDKHGIYNNTRIRRLTPKECFRLQGFPDEYFERARQVNSDSQLYKQAGNSVTVNVIHEIAQRL